MINPFKKIWLFAATALLFTGCGGKQMATTLFQKRTPYQTYVHNLETAKLHQSALGKAWIMAGEKALLDSLPAKLPYQETGYFKAEKPVAASLTFQAKQGEIIEIQAKLRTKQPVKLFVDLFEKSSFQQITHLAAADTANLRLEFKAENNTVYLVRLQPELLSSGSYTISIASKPSLGFPVAGKDSRAVQSFWGADRDNGSRRHEGIDIFAAKGTPAIASAKGIVTRVSETPIGGKVVWVSDLSSRQNLYYAHLDKQLVQPGQQVNPGDTLGLIGNTGNARTTPPHLHFGIYTFGRGAVDPFPFIHTNNKQPETLKINEAHLGNWGRVARNNVAVRVLPEGKAAIVAKLAKNEVVTVLAGTGNWYKVQLPNGPAGFLHKDNFEALSKPVTTQTLETDAELMEFPEISAAPVAALKKHAKVTVLGFYHTFQLVKLADGTLGWLLKS